MIGLTVLLVLVALLGCLPLILFLVKRRSYRHLLASGQKTAATVSEIVPGMRGRYGIVNEKVFYFFVTSGGFQYKGMFVATPRKYRREEKLEVYYMPDNPDINSIKTRGYGTGYLLLLSAMAIGVAWMMFKVYQMVSQGGE